MITSRMESIEWKKWGRTVSFFLFSRYPIANGLTFLMLLGERAKRETQPPLDPNIIYGHVGVMIGAGLAMGFNFRRKPAALIHVCQLVYLCFSVQVNEKLKYADWLTNKICLRMLGTAGFFLLYAFFTCAKPRPQYLRRIGETIVGLYVACYLFQLLREPVEKQAFLKLAIGGSISLYLLAIILGACALCYIPGLFVVDITQALVISLWFVTVAVDSRISYWTKNYKVDYWIQVRLILDHFAMIIGCVMYLTCTKKYMAVDATNTQQGAAKDDDDDDDLELVDQLPMDQPVHHAHPNPEADDDSVEQTENQLNEQTEQEKKEQ